MENKIKFNKTYEPEFCIADIDGHEIKVKKQISYNEKIDFAKEYAASMCVIDEKFGIAYRAYDQKPIWVYLICKYFTNIDVDGFEFDTEALYDAIYPYLNKITSHFIDDYYECEEIAETYVDRTLEIYNSQNSLNQKIKIALSGILNGEDLIKMISESKGVNEEMINLLAKARNYDEQENNVVVFPWAAKKGE